MPTYTAYARFGDLYLQFPFERDTPDLVCEGDLELADLELSVSLEVPGAAFAAFDAYAESDWMIVDEQLELVMVSQLFFREPGPAEIYREIRAERTEELRRRLESRSAELVEWMRQRRNPDADGRIQDGAPDAPPHPRLRRPWQEHHDSDE